MGEVRINKFLASCGAASRREADKIVSEGRVTINGEIATTGSKVSDGDIVTLNGKVIKPNEDKVVLAYYKPVGVTVTEKDAHAARTIASEIKYPVRVTYAGRLDKDSEGLLLLTNDGDLIDAVMRGANMHDKEYIVKTDKKVDESFADKMRSGIYLKELKATTRACRVEILGPYTFSIILTQGLNRQIRRMCEALGYKVKSLKRIRVMNIKLNNLKPGEYRELIEEERRELYRLAGLHE